MIILYMWNWSTKKKITAIFLAAIIIRLVVVAFLGGEYPSISAENDQYLQIARNLLEGRTYSTETGQNPKADNFRTPIVPLFLMSFMYFNFPFHLVTLANAILMALAAVLLFVFGRRLFDERTAFIAAVLFGLEPYGTLISTRAVAEAPFVLLLTLSVFLLGLYVKEGKFDYLYFGSFMLAVASLTKPIALPLFILIPVAGLFEKFVKRFDEKTAIFTKQKMAWEQIMVSLVIFILVISPWFAFNKLVIGTWSFSSSANYDIYRYNIGNLIKLFLSSGYENIASGTAPVRAGNWFFALVSIFAFSNLLIHIAKKTFNPCHQAFFLITLVIFTLIASPGGEARLRIPIDPILFLLALDSLATLTKRSQSPGEQAVPDAERN